MLYTAAAAMLAVALVYTYYPIFVRFITGGGCGFWLGCQRMRWLHSCPLLQSSLAPTSGNLLVLHSSTRMAVQCLAHNSLQQSTVLCLPPRRPGADPHARWRANHPIDYPDDPKAHERWLVGGGAMDPGRRAAPAADRWGLPPVPCPPDNDPWLAGGLPGMENAEIWAEKQQQRGWRAPGGNPAPPAISPAPAAPGDARLPGPGRGFTMGRGRGLGLGACHATAPLPSYLRIARFWLARTVLVRSMLPGLQQHRRAHQQPVVVPMY